MKSFSHQCQHVDSGCCKPCSGPFEYFHYGFRHFLKDNHWIVTKDGHAIGSGLTMHDCLRDTIIDSTNHKAYFLHAPNGMRMSIVSTLVYNSMPRKEAE